MHPITSDRPLPIGGAQLPLVEDNKGTAQTTQVAAGELNNRGEGRVQGVDLPQPKPGINQQVTPAQQQELGQVMKTVQQGAANASKLLAHSSLLTKLAFTSPEEFEIELGKMTSELEQTQKKLKLADIERARAENLKKIDENQTKMKEAGEAADKAKKSGLAAKIFGWISAIASIVLGAIMIATGIGAAAGAMMIVGGAVGIANMAVQQAAEDGRISPEDMKILGPIMMAAEILIAIITVVVTLGTSAASTASKAVKFATQAADLVLDVSGGVTKTVDSAMQAHLQTKQADLLENRQAMTLLEGVMDKLKDALSQMTEAFQQVMEMIFQMITARGAMFNNLASRPAAI